jgi:F-type H+-transporting ATPase subunit a
LLAAASEDGTFKGPSISEFFPPVIFFEGTPFEINRIILIRFIMATVLILFFYLATRKLKVVPGKGQSLAEMALDLVRVNIVEDLLGKKDGRHWLLILRREAS